MILSMVNLYLAIFIMIYNFSIIVLLPFPVLFNVLLLLREGWGRLLSKKTYDNMAHLVPDL